MNEEQIIDELNRLAPYMKWDISLDPGGGNPHGEPIICRYWAKIPGTGFSFEDSIYMHHYKLIEAIVHRTKYEIADEYYRCFSGCYTGFLTYEIID